MVPTIKQLCEDWQEKTQPKSLPPIVQRELSRAFYSGAASLFIHIREIADLPGDEPQKAVFKVADEFEAYFADMMKTIDSEAQNDRGK